MSENAMAIIRRLKKKAELNPRLLPELKQDMEDAYYSLRTEYAPSMIKLHKRQWEMVRGIIDCVFTLYPNAYIYQMPTAWEKEGEEDPGGMIVGFRALGGEGSDDVHIMPDGEWSQWMSGDLDLNRLEMLEETAKAIIKIFRGLAKGEPLIHSRFILFPKKEEE